MRKRTSREKTKISEGIKSFRESLQLNRRDFAERIGTSYSYIWAIENGIRGTGYELIERMGKVFGRKPNIEIPEDIEEFKVKTHRIVPVDAIKDIFKVNRDDFRLVPLVSGQIAAGQGFVTQEDIEDIAVIHVSQIGKSGNLVAVKIQDNKAGENTGMSMWPILGPGDIVAIDKDDRTPRKNKIYAIRVKMGDQAECTVKYIEQTENDILVLIPENKSFPIQTIKLRENPNPVIGRVIWCWRSLK